MCRGCKLREGLVRRAHQRAADAIAALDQARACFADLAIDTAGPDHNRPRAKPHAVRKIARTSNRPLGPQLEFAL